MARLLLVDDDAMVRALVRQFLAVRKDWQICGEASDGVEAVEMTRLFAPDVVILDIAMPRQNGLQAARQIVKESHTPVLALTLYDPNMISSQMVDAGIRGVVSKTSIGSELIAAVDALLMGETYFKASLAHRA
jgi:NarL family two-component system response regulator LiaR